MNLIPPSLAVAKIKARHTPAPAPEQTYGCKPNEDGAMIKLFDRELGFSSMESCEQQIEFLKATPSGVVCGCAADNTPAGPMLSIIGAMMGLVQVTMNLECYQMQGDQLERVKFISHGMIREVNIGKSNGGKAEKVFGERVEACRQQEAQLFYELNGYSSNAETKNPNSLN